MRRELVALGLTAGLGFGFVTPALATPSLVASGDATSITSSSAELNGVVSRQQTSDRWLFQYGTSWAWSLLRLTTTPVLAPGRLSAVAHQVTGLYPATTYEWRVVLLVTNGRRTTRTFGAIKRFTTPAAETTTASTTPTAPTLPTTSSTHPAPTTTAMATTTTTPATTATTSTLSASGAASN